MPTKKNKPRGWGLLKGTVEQDYADIKRWERSLSDEEWNRLLDLGDKDIRKLETASKKRLAKLRRQRAA